MDHWQQSRATVRQQETRAKWSHLVKVSGAIAGAGLMLGGVYLWAWQLPAKKPPFNPAQWIEYAKTNGCKVSAKVDPGVINTMPHGVDVWACSNGVKHYKNPD